MTNIKNGKTRSVGVIPFHSACSNGANMRPQLPGLFTKIIPAIVIPRRISIASILLLFVVVALMMIVFNYLYK